MVSTLFWDASTVASGLLLRERPNPEDQQAESGPEERVPLEGVWMFLENESEVLVWQDRLGEIRTFPIKGHDIAADNERSFHASWIPAAQDIQSRAARLPYSHGGTKEQMVHVPRGKIVRFTDIMGHKGEELLKDGTKKAESCAGKLNTLPSAIIEAIEKGGKH